MDKEILHLIKKGNLTCLTGSGISAESGIPTFRGKGGLWERYSPEIYATTMGLISTLETQPEKLVDFLREFYSSLLIARPNPGHLTLAIMEKEGILNSIITQNVDNLHQQAGARRVIELHGNAYRVKCMGCGRTLTLERDRLKEMVDLLKRKRNSRFGMLRILSRYFPKCECKGRFRIDIVLFGEGLSGQVLSEAYRQLDNCGLLLVVGCSLMVYPAAGLPLYAKEKGAQVLEINSDPSGFSDLCDFKIVGKAAEVLPELIKES